MLLTAAAVASAGAAPPREVVTELSAALARVGRATSIGLFVVDVADGEVWFARDERLLLKPASVFKLFTTAAALERFGPAFQYETGAYLSGSDLWLQGSGDPGIGDERVAESRGESVNTFWDRLVAGLRANNVTAVDNLVLDDSVFDTERRHGDWPDAQADAWYQAPVGGLNLNDNCVDARVRVGANGLELLLQPPLPAEMVRNVLKRGKRHAPTATRKLGSDILEFRGTVARNEDFGPIAVGDPTVFFGFALREALRARGIDVRGNVSRARFSADQLSRAASLYVHRTSLREVIWRSNTFSQNLFAECLLKSLEAYDPSGARSGKAGSWEGGRRVLGETLQRIGLDLRDAQFRDGSGLSHENRVTAEQVTQLLLTMRRHRSADVFFESLAVAGREGSMKRRYADPRLVGHLHGKTGTIAGVNALAGYVERTDGTTLAFALLVNGSGSESLPLDVARTLVTAGLRAAK